MVCFLPRYPTCLYATKKFISILLPSPMQVNCHWRSTTIRERRASRFRVTSICRLSKIPNIVAVKMPLPPDDDYAGELSAIRATTSSAFRVGYSGDWGGAASLLAGGDTWNSVVAGLQPAETVALTRAAHALDVEMVKQIDTAFEPLWTLFKEFGSFRVMYVIAELLDLCRAKPSVAYTAPAR